MKGYYVYIFLSENEEVLYVGSTINLHSRIVSQHFRSNCGNLSEECLTETKSIYYHKNTSDSEMKVYERYLINTKQPKYNKHMSKGDSFDFVLNFNWELFTKETEKLLITPIRDFSYSKNEVINHIVETIKVDSAWIQTGFYLKRKTKKDMTTLTFKETDEDGFITKRVISLISINSRWYINDWKNLSYYVANYRNNRAENFISVVYEDLVKKYDLELKKNGQSPLAGIDFVEIEHAFTIGDYTVKESNLICKKISKTIFVH